VADDHLGAHPVIDKRFSIVRTPAVNAQTEPSAPPSPKLPTHVLLAPDFPGLLAVRRRGINLAIWQRSVDPVLERYLDDLPPSELPDTRFSCRGDQVAAAIADEVHACEQDHPGRRLLVADLIALASDYARLVDDGKLSLRIERIDSDLCTKYHCDATGLRLLTTYRGPGTCWVPNAAVERNQLGPLGTNPDIVPDAAQVRSLPRFAVGLLKGERLGSSDGDPAIVHRSPAIEGTGQVRLLLCVEPWQPGHGH